MLISWPEHDDLPDVDPEFVWRCAAKAVCTPTQPVEPASAAQDRGSPREHST
jgi:hypothetical protein